MLKYHINGIITIYVLDGTYGRVFRMQMSKIKICVCFEKWSLCHEVLGRGDSYAGH